MCEVNDFVTHFVGTCDNHVSFAAAKCVVYIEGGATPVAVALEVEGGNIVTFP